MLFWAPTARETDALSLGAGSGSVVVSFLSNKFPFKLAESFFFYFVMKIPQRVQNGVQKSFVILNRNMDFILGLLLNKSLLNMFLRMNGT